MPVVNADRLMDFVAQIFCATRLLAGRSRAHRPLSRERQSHQCTTAIGVTRGAALCIVEARWPLARRSGGWIVLSIRRSSRSSTASSDLARPLRRRRCALGIEKCRGARTFGHRSCAIPAMSGRVGEWAEMAAEAGIVSVHFVNVASSGVGGAVWWCRNADSRRRRFAASACRIQVACR